MVMVCEKLGIAYYAIPKVACTSIKSCLHELETGKPFTRGRNGKTLHATYPSRAFDPDQFATLGGMFTIAVVRDPIKRILSAYTNKAAQIGWVEMRKAERQKSGFAGLVGRVSGKRRGGRPRTLPDTIGGLSLTPTANEFLENLAAYREAFHVVRQHTYPHAHFLGDDLARYDRIYRIEDLGELEADLSARCGRKIVLPKSNPSTRKLSLSEVSDRAFDVLRAETAADYAYLGDFYQPPARRPAASPAAGA